MRAVHRPLLERLPPLGDVLLDALAPRPVLLALEQRPQQAQRRRAVTHEVHFHGIADRQHACVDVDLHAARAALRRQEFRVRKIRADHQQRVAAHHHPIRRPRAEQADRAGDEWQRVGDRRLAEERLGDARAQHVGDLEHFGGRLKRARPDQHRHLVAGVQHVGRALQLVLVGRRPRNRVADARMHGAVLASRWLGGELLDVVRHDDAGRRTLRTRDAQRTVDDVTHLLRRHDHLDVLARDVLEQHGKIDFLLVAPAERRPRLLPDDRDDRLVIELGVVETVQQVNGAGTGRREAHADLSRELGVRAGHEGRHLLVAHLHELERVARPVEGAHQAVDAVAGVAEDAPDAPFAEALEEKIANRHGRSRLCGATAAPVRSWSGWGRASSITAPARAGIAASRAPVVGRDATRAG
jgi:hypothetical protein